MTKKVCPMVGKCLLIVFLNLWLSMAGEKSWIRLFMEG